MPILTTALCHHWLQQNVLMRFRGNAPEVRQHRAVVGGVLGALLSLAVSRSSPDAGIPLSDVALAAALAAGLAAFPRALLGAALGLLTVVIAIRERPAWDRWRDGMNIVWWFSILGLAAYGRSWGLDFAVRCLKTLVAAARSTVRSLGASWSRGAAARRHPTHWMRVGHSVGLWAWRGLEPRARRY